MLYESSLRGTGRFLIDQTFNVACYNNSTALLQELTGNSASDSVMLSSSAFAFGKPIFPLTVVQVRKRIHLANLGEVSVRSVISDQETTKKARATYFASSGSSRSV